MLHHHMQTHKKDKNYILEKMYKNNLRAKFTAGECIYYVEINSTRTTSIFHEII